MRAASALLPLLALLPMGANAATPGELRDYALAACLTRQTASPELRAEGYHLADIVLERAHASPPAWQPLTTTVAAALARQGLLMVHVDGPVAGATRSAPLASCMAVADSPAVARAMRKIVSPPHRR